MDLGGAQEQAVVLGAREVLLAVDVAVVLQDDAMNGCMTMMCADDGPCPWARPATGPPTATTEALLQACMCGGITVTDQV